MMQKLCLLLILSGFVSPLVTAQTTIDTTITHDGLTRSYRLYIPDSFNNSQSVPLVLNLHGYGSNNAQQEVYGDFRDIADTANFLIAHPNGTIDTSGSRFWDAFGASSVDDVGFLSSLIDTIKNRYSIDTNRIYSTGMSNGGIMSHQLACRLNERITAIASVAGTITPGQRNTCNPVSPTPVMQIHGTNDGTVPYNGNNRFLSVDSVINYWVNYNNCSSPPTVKQIPNKDTSDGCTAERQIYPDGDENSRVELYKVIDGGHTWPGASINIGVTNQDFNASKVIWEFFNRYPAKDTTTGFAKVDDKSNNWQIYPNPSKGQINFQFADNSQKEINIYDDTGKNITAFTCSCKTTNMTLDENGIYFITIDKANNHLTKRILIR